MLVWVLVVVAAFGAFVMVRVHLDTQRMICHLREADLTLAPVDRPLHDDAEAAIRALERAGFTLETCGTATIPPHAPRAFCLLRSATGAAIAEVGVDRAGKGARVTLAFESRLSDGRLATQSVQGLVTPPGDLKQVLPGAGVDELVREHERALEALAAAGQPAQTVPVGGATHLWEATLRQEAERHPSGFGITVRALRIILGRVEDRGSVVDRGLV